MSVRRGPSFRGSARPFRQILESALPQYGSEGCVEINVELYRSVVRSAAFRSIRLFSEIEPALVIMQMIHDQFPDVSEIVIVGDIARYRREVIQGTDEFGNPDQGGAFRWLEDNL